MKNKIRQFKCANCGGEMQLQNQRSQYVACQYCGSVAETSSDAHKILSKMDNPAKYPSMSFIKLGLEGVFNGKTHHVIGRTRRKNKYKEYWKEGNEFGYSDEEWIFDEWLLISEDGTYFTIIEDSEGYAIVKSIIPKYPSLPREEKIQDFYNQKIQIASEYGATEILYYEGESTYLVQTGFKSGFSQYNQNGHSYSVEWRYENEKIKEVEFFEETPISKNKLKQIFKIVSEKKPVQEAKKNEPKRLKNRYLAIAAGIINFIIAISLFSNGKINEIFNKDIYLFSDIPTQEWKSVNDTLQVISFKKDFTLLPETKLINISSACYMPDSSECITEILCLNKNNDTVFYDMHYFYKYAFSLNAIDEGKFKDYYEAPETKKPLSLIYSIKVPNKCFISAPIDTSNDIHAKISIKEMENKATDRWCMNFILGLIFIFLAIGAFIFKK